MKRTELSEIGEFGLINRIKERVTTSHPNTSYGIGDDAAVINTGSEQHMLLSTDLLIEGIHFDLTYCPLRHLGYKAIAVNVSDIAAMNGIPAQVTVSLGLSNRMSLEAIEELYEGIYHACEDYKIDIIGGDTTSSRSGLIISVAVTGFAKPEQIVYRKNAKVGDVVCVTGDLGAAYLGLQVLEREKQVFLANPKAEPELAKYDYIVGRQLKPKARMDIIHQLHELNVVPNAMIDVSDGLASEIMHICTQSEVGVRIFDEEIPLDNMMVETAMEFKLDTSMCAMNGGEDYELLFTIPPAKFEQIKSITDITAIGIIEEKSKGYHLIGRTGQAHAIKAQGWVHF